MTFLKRIKGGALALAVTAGVTFGVQTVNAQNPDFDYKPLTAKIEEYSKRHAGLELVITTDVNGDGKDEKIVFNGAGSKFIKARGLAKKKGKKDFYRNKKTGRTIMALTKGKKRYALVLDPQDKTAIRGALYPLNQAKRGKNYIFAKSDNELIILKKNGRWSSYNPQDADMKREELAKYAPRMSPLLASIGKELPGVTAPGSSALAMLRPQPVVPDLRPKPKGADPQAPEVKEKPQETTPDAAPSLRPKAYQAKQSVNLRPKAYQAKKAKTKGGLELITDKYNPSNKAEVEKQIAAYSPKLAARLHEVYRTALGGRELAKKGEILYTIEVCKDKPAPGRVDAKVRIEKDGFGYDLGAKSLAAHLEVAIEEIRPNEGCIQLSYTFKN